MSTNPAGRFCLDAKRLGTVAESRPFSTERMALCAGDLVQLDSRKSSRAALNDEEDSMLTM
jgi:hypothetical protein